MSGRTPAIWATVATGLIVVVVLVVFAVHARKDKPQPMAAPSLRLHAGEARPRCVWVPLEGCRDSVLLVGCDVAYVVPTVRETVAFIAGRLRAVKGGRIWVGGSWWRLWDTTPVKYSVEEATEILNDALHREFMERRQP